VSSQAKAPRDFTYIRPRKRRLSEYEAVTCYTQPDPEVFDKQGWYLRTAEGRTAWRKESTRLSHPHWFDFRDPAALWQRPYVRMQAEQERSLERAVEDAARGGAFRDFDPIWTREIVGGHYRVWSFFEYGLFRCFAQAQRETLSDTLGNVYCFAGVDRMRHAQAIVIYLMDLEDQIEGFRDVGAKERWLSDPIYQPMRRLTEELMAIEDWAELPVAVHLSVDPILSEVGASEIVRRHGASTAIRSARRWSPRRSAIGGATSSGRRNWCAW
jgi:Methane/Phenol/Alkene Hydroxylase